MDNTQRITQLYSFVISLFVLSLFSAFRPAATAPIEGVVLDAATSEPIIGATISIDGKQAAAITNINGEFSIPSIAFPAHLSVSYMGFERYTLTVDKPRQRVEIKLKEQSNTLDEVAVVGYGTQKRTQLTGAVTKVSADIFEHSAAPTLDAALSGQVAGLNITQPSGQPGAAPQIRIRGGNSVNAANEPLYVVDGFIYFKDPTASKTGLGAIESSLNPLATINPQDIERIEVLKDISATAIYGSRGANGVVIITTKKGNVRKPTINYTYTLGTSSATRRLQLMDAKTWAEFQKTYYNNKGGYTDEQIAALGSGTDWQDAMLRNALSQSHQLSVSGGTEKGRYALSANYTDQQGVVINTGFRRYNFHLNTDWHLSDRLTAGVNATFGKATQSGLTTTEQTNYNSSPFSAGITNSFVYGLLTPPVVSVRNADGSFNYHNPYEYAYFAIGDHSANAVSDLTNSTAKSINNYLLANLWAEYAWGDFVAKATWSLNREDIQQLYFSPSYTSLGLAVDGIGGIGTKNSEVWQHEYTLTWSRELNANNHIDAMAGYTQQRSAYRYVTSLASHFTNESLGVDNLADASDIYPIRSGHSSATLNSIIGRVNYTLLNRYNATATFRADHSSRFAAHHRWGYFPSLGLSWNVDRERFLRNNPTISALKLRASAGVVGNQEIGDFLFTTSYTAGQYDGSSSYSKNNAANDQLKWETTASYNIGADLSLWHGLVDVTADYYYKKTSDLLLDVPVGYELGVNSQLQNVGNVVNKGVELSVNANIVRQKDFDLNVFANAAHNHNAITSMGSTQQIITGASSEQILRKGEALGSFYGLVFNGIVQEGEDVTKLPTLNGQTPQPGDIKYADTNNDHRIDGNDRVVLGSIQPDLTYGFGASLNLHQWDISIAFAGNHGNKVFNALRRRLEQTSDSYNLLAEVANSWTKENASNRYPLGSLSRPTSYIDSRYVESASYLKLRNVTLGYTFDLRQRLGLQLRLFANATNLFTLSPYSGYDPEVASGTDSGAYPASRSLSVGASLTF